jgi:hypothetical protein
MSGSEENNYRFKIDVFSIDSLPMARLAEYMGEFARLLGEEERVHFSHLEKGSAILVSIIEPPAVLKVAERVSGIRDGHGPKDALKAFKALDGMLAKDNAVGTLISPEGAEIIPFPGRTRPKPMQYGPFRERGSIDGVVIRVGGKDETVPVYLQDGERILACETSREISKRLAGYYLDGTIRAHGTGTWMRKEDGSWELKKFIIEEFEVLDESPLAEVINRLRSIEGGVWVENNGANSDLLSLRRDDESKH